MAIESKDVERECRRCHKTKTMRQDGVCEDCLGKPVGRKERRARIPVRTKRKFKSSAVAKRKKWLAEDKVQNEAESREKKPVERESEVDTVVPGAVE